MSRNRIGAGKLLPFAAVVAMSAGVGPSPAADMVQERSGTTTQTIPVGPEEVVQTIQSRMEPTAVQVRQRTNPATGEREQIVEPIIMERHERLLETRITQPVVVESEKRHSLSTASESTTAHQQVGSSRLLSHRRVAGSQQAASQVTNVRSSTREQSIEIKSQPMIRQTIIPGEPETAPEPPQVIQKSESQ